MSGGTGRERLQLTRLKAHPGLGYALGVYAWTRLLTSVWAALVAGFKPIEVLWEGSFPYETIRVALPHSGRLADLLLGVWYRWDTAWFMTIAVSGYGQFPEAVVFPPLYPLLVRWLGWLLGGEYLLAGLVISNAAYVGALYLLYRLVRAEFSAAVTRSALIWLAVFPAAFYFLAAYTESLFLLLAVLSLQAARCRRWLLAGVFAALATLTRWTGVALAVPLAWEALAAAGWTAWPIRCRAWLESARQAWRGLLAAAAGPLAVLAWGLYVKALSQSSPLETYGRSWHTELAWPWQNIVEAVKLLFGREPSLVQAVGLVMLFAFLTLTVLGIKRLRPSWWLFALGGQLFFLLRIQQARPLESTLRYLAVLFPCFVVLALEVKNRWLRAGLTVGLGLLQALLLALFVRWYWVA